MKLDIFMNERLKQVLTVGPNGIPPLEPDWTLIDTQYHPGVDPHVDNHGWEGNHAPWHHVRNALYRRGHQNMAIWTIHHSGDGMPNVPTPPETQHEGVNAFTQAEIVDSFETETFTAPDGETNIMVGLIMNLAVVGGQRWAYGSDLNRVRVFFGDKELTTSIAQGNNAAGQFMQIWRGNDMPTTGKLKVMIDSPEICQIGPTMGQLTFVKGSVALQGMASTQLEANRSLSVTAMGQPSIRFWAAVTKPTWQTGPIIPGAMDQTMEQYTVEQSAVVKGGTLWKPSTVEFEMDALRYGGKLEYAPATGIFTFTRENYDSNHPTAGVLIKRWGQAGAADLKGHFYLEVEGTPADFDTQPDGTVNLGLHLCQYINGVDNNLRKGNQRDTACIRRVYTTEAPTHLHVIEPSDSNQVPDRAGLLLYVRGLKVGRSIKFRIMNNGLAMRAAIGKTKTVINAGTNLNVSLADWTVVKQQGPVNGALITSGTNLPDGAVPIR